MRQGISVLAEPGKGAPTKIVISDAVLDSFENALNILNTAVFETGLEPDQLYNYRIRDSIFNSYGAKNAEAVFEDINRGLRFNVHEFGHGIAHLEGRAFNIELLSINGKLTPLDKYRNGGTDSIPHSYHPF